MTKSEVQTILDNADINNDGKLDYSEVKCNVIYIATIFLILNKLMFTLHSTIKSSIIYFIEPHQFPNVVSNWI